MNESPRSPWLWVLVGCGGILLLAMCGFTGAAFYFGMREGGFLTGDAPGVVPVGTAPSDKPVPGAGGPIVPSGPPGIDAASPIAVTATVVRTSGSMPVPNGARCGFAVEQHAREDGSTWCRTQIVCDGRLLYGGRQAGYFDCTFEAGADAAVVGGDPMTTRDDGDAAIEIDTRRGTLVVRDDDAGAFAAFQVDARVTEVRISP